MGSRSDEVRWLEQLTHLPTASGLEHHVVDWVKTWVGRRPDLKLAQDSGGNLLITHKGRTSRPPVLAAAHMDHPGFVATKVDGKSVSFEFRGGVNPEYFDDAKVRFLTTAKTIDGVVEKYEPKTQTGRIAVTKTGVQEGDIGVWKFPRSQPAKDRFLAPACDDLAGCAAALSALDKTRNDPSLRHFGVLLTRAEEVGLVGAIHAAKMGTLPADCRILSIETSRELPYAPIGEGPIIRVGDAVTIFDPDLSNRITFAARKAGLRHQRKLMDGGGCEATAFGVYGYAATGLCLALGNWHNRGNLDEFESGSGEPVPMKEEISLSDYHGLVDLLVLSATAVDEETDLRARFDALYDETGEILTRMKE